MLQEFVSLEGKNFEAKLLTIFCNNNIYCKIQGTKKKRLDNKGITFFQTAKKL